MGKVWSSVWKGLSIAIKTPWEGRRKVTMEEAVEELQWEEEVHRHLRSWEGRIRLWTLLCCQPRHDRGTVEFHRSLHGMTRQHVGCGTVLWEVKGRRR